MTTAESRLADDVGFVTEQIAQQAGLPPAPKKRQRRARALRPILWRLHFLGGVLAGPIVLSLAVTGILFAWNPQIDQVRFGKITGPSSTEVNHPLADQVAAASSAHPDWTVHSVVPGNADRNTAILMDPPGGESRFGSPSDGVNVYVDQATGEVTGSVAKSQESGQILRKLHSSWRLGENFEPLTELAGSWFVASLITGVYLWWPGLRKRGSAAFALRRRLKGRRQSKEWHNFIGVALFVPMFFLAVTGLTWTQFAGDRVDLFRDNVLTVRAGGVDTALAGPANGQADPANIDRTYRTARGAELVDPISITLPPDDLTGWKVQSQDTRFPLERDQIVVNGTTGEIASSFDYSSEHWFNKLRTAAILFHQAQLFGVPLQFFMTVLALGVGALVVFGYRMWWQRRPSGGLGAPPPLRQWVTRAPLAVLAAVLFLGWLMPTLGASLLLWLVLERTWYWVRAVAGTTACTSRLDLPKAVLLAGSGAAILYRPGLGESAEELATIPRLAVWLWSIPVGIGLLSAGLIGLFAVLTAGRSRPEPASG